MAQASQWGGSWRVVCKLGLLLVWFGIMTACGSGEQSSSTLRWRLQFEPLDREAQIVDLVIDVRCGLSDASIAVEVEQGAEQVVITTIVSGTSPGDVCGDDLELEATAELDEPLGSRDLVDGSCPDICIYEP